MKIAKTASCLALIGAVCLPGLVQAQEYGFENENIGPLPITPIQMQGVGVTIYMRVGGVQRPAYIAQYGGTDGNSANPAEAFWSNQYPKDASCNRQISGQMDGAPSATSLNLGCQFLTDDGLRTSKADTILVIEYDKAVTGASGLILDIDGDEVWNVEAYDGNSVVAQESFCGPTATITNCTQTMSASSSDPVAKGSRNMDHIGKFELSAPQFSRIEISYRGGGVPGIGFDNFNANTAHKETEYDPCCPPWNSDTLAESLKITPTGSINQPYLVQFDPTQALKDQMQAYIDYLGAIDACSGLVLAFSVHDFQGNQPPNGFPAGHTQWKIANSDRWVKWTEQQNGPQFSSFYGNAIQFQVGRWYRISTGMYCEPEKSFFGQECAVAYVDFMIDVSGPISRRSPGSLAKRVEGPTLRIRRQGRNPRENAVPLPPGKASRIWNAGN